MPRRRTIFCNHCGYAQLKRDNTCDRCLRLTARGKKRLAVSVGGGVAMLITAFWVLHQIEGAARTLGSGG